MTFPGDSSGFSNPLNDKVLLRLRGSLDFARDDGKLLSPLHEIFCYALNGFFCFVAKRGERG